jgi:Fe-S cluster assembly iron-binding protein IscA
MYNSNNVEGCEGYRYKFKYDTKLNDKDCVIEEPEQPNVLFATDE